MFSKLSTKILLSILLYSAWIENACASNILAGLLEGVARRETISRIPTRYMHTESLRASRGYKPPRQVEVDPEVLSPISLPRRVRELDVTGETYVPKFSSKQQQVSQKSAEPPVKSDGNTLVVDLKKKL